MKNTDSFSMVAPRGLGLGELEPRIACAIRTYSSSLAEVFGGDSYGLYIVMQADVPEEDVRFALQRLGFKKRTGWIREDAGPGEVRDGVLLTYGVTARNLSENNSQFARFRETFPSQTVVISASLLRSHDDPAAPHEDPQPAPWRCSYSPTYNEDWHDDILCTNGTETDRPYLRAWDSFVTYEEIMESAREYERQLNNQ